jgi:hypothetical protein
MRTNILASILSLKGQRVNYKEHDQKCHQIVIHCSRDRRLKAVDPYTGLTVNQYVRRQVRDVPLFGLPCVLNIELAQVWISKNERHIESTDFVGKDSRYTNRFCQLISGLCQHMSIQAVSRHLAIRWETIKNMDRYYLESTLPALDHGLLKSGSKTEGLGWYYHGSAGVALRGLEISTIRITDLKSNTAYALNSLQAVDLEGKTRVDQYTQQVIDVAVNLRALNILILCSRCLLTVAI